MNRREAGYAMLTAIVAMALLALFSLGLLDSARGTTAVVAAQVERARLMAAADGGLAYAADRLAAPRGERWSLDGRPHGLALGGVRVTIVVEDERGKIPINQLSDEQVRSLFETLGATGDALDTMTDSLLDWIDDDDVPREAGAEAGWYARRGLVPRNGPLRSIDELVHIRGVPPGYVERLRGVVSLSRDASNGFDDRYAQPFALAVMSGSGVDGPAAIQRARELAGQRVAIDLDDGAPLAGRLLTVRVEARGTGDSRFVRTAVIEMTGGRRPAYIVRGLS